MIVVAGGAGFIGSQLITGAIAYMPFPKSLKNSYQSFTQADMSKLRSVGRAQAFISLKERLAH